MTDPRSHFLEGTPRLHYLEWHPQGRDTLVLLHGNSGNAWWWQPLADAIGNTQFRILALDQRGHGDSQWVRPPAYTPDDYARDLTRFIQSMKLDRPIVAGHSMGGISVIAFAAQFGPLARAAIAIDIAVSSTPGRDRFLRRLKRMPTVVYPDRATAIERFRLMPDEGAIPAAVIAGIARHSLERTADGRYTLKFDRASFIGSDGLEVRAAIERLAIPTLLIRAGLSRIMSAEATADAARSNPLVRVAVIPDAHHHLPLEAPDALAHAIAQFAATGG